MAHYSVKAIHADLVPSRLLFGLLCGMHGVGLLVSAFMPLDGLARLGLLLALAGSAAYCRWQLRRAPRGLSLAMDGTLSVRLGNDEWVPAEVLGSSFVQPWLAVLHLRLEGARRMLPLVLLPDMLQAEDFRRLRVWLMWGWRERREI